MLGGSFSLAEKLALAGAFLAMVALAVGTSDDPGIVAEQAKRQADRPGPANHADAEAASSPSSSNRVFRDYVPEKGATQKSAPVIIGEAPDAPPIFDD